MSSLRSLCRSRRGGISRGITFLIEFFKRVLATYVICGASIAITLLVIGKLPWDTQMDVALRRITLIAFPAAFGAVISDNIK